MHLSAVDLAEAIYFNFKEILLRLPAFCVSVLVLLMNSYMRHYNFLNSSSKIHDNFDSTDHYSKQSLLIVYSADAFA